MPDANSRLTVIQQLLPRAVGGDEAAMNSLLQHTSERFTLLTRRMLGDFDRVRRWAETDDVLQSALVRLVGALRSVQPQTAREFLALASLQIRRELIDLARHFYGPEGIGANHDSQTHAGPSAPVPPEPSDRRYEPASLAQWTELHASIEALPDEQRDVMGLLFYQGLSQAEAAEVLNVGLRTVQRRWHDALCKLHEVWNGS